MNKVTYLYFILLLTCSIPDVVSAQATSRSSHPNTSTPAIDSYSEKLILEENANQNIQMQKILILNSLINDQKQQILHMQKKINKLEDNSGLNFAVWTGILLASVSIILTVLGIVMAIFSFFGYRNMKNRAKDAATKISIEKASEVTEQLAPEVTERVLLKLINEGNFNKLIFEAVQKITYRGVEFSSGDMLEDSKQERVE
ncbi:hypothetical protein [Arsenophonus apicola]|uniref:Uncharacterized protein n=1 Tax=Arsenophonus apicola TaxID=2879119 RepID=A0ABY8P2A3_9GAMM|nr:hypothetical protein [Arsenophonus apicola]WGO83622.1 hypothetical protein QG404_01455 [Arsenophonus apicola]